MQFKYIPVSSLIELRQPMVHPNNPLPSQKQVVLIMSKSLYLSDWPIRGIRTILLHNHTDLHTEKSCTAGGYKPFFQSCGHAKA